QARFVVDLRKRNSVTQHLPVDPGDQDHILHTLARARYRSAIDLKDGYPQVRIHPDDEKFAAFITPQGTFATRTMEQGDCNAPNTFTKIIQHIMGPYVTGTDLDVDRNQQQGVTDTRQEIVTVGIDEKD